MESEKKAFFSLSTCTFKISVSAYYNTPQSKNIEKKIHDKLLDLIIRILFIRIIEIKQILFYSSTKRKFSVHCFKLYTLKKKLYKKNINKLYKKNTYDMINLNSKTSKRPLESALLYSETL